MLKSEKRSLLRFLAIYLTSTFILFGVASWIFYLYMKTNLYDQEQKALKYEARVVKSKLRELHISNDEVLIYPNNRSFKTAIYDLDKKYIFGTLSEDTDMKRLQDMKNHICIVSKVEPYYLGAAYLVVCKIKDNRAIEDLQRNIYIFLICGGVLFSILGYFLGRLFIAPMRESIEKINHFIQDATHELNTPISTILTNIEMIETLDKCPKAFNELKRIEIASKTLSRIYGDLAYLNLNHKYHRDIVEVDMSRLLEERIIYFSSMIEAKNLDIKKEIKKSVKIEIDKNDAIRLIDNLLSNAIKYNVQNGYLRIKLDKTSFVVEDGGIGIDSKNLKLILTRFKRANKSEGGFGIGLDIVNQIVNNYDFSLDMESVENRGTKVEIRWKRYS